MRCAVCRRQPRHSIRRAKRVTVEARRIVGRTGTQHLLKQRARQNTPVQSMVTARQDLPYKCIRAGDSAVFVTRQ